MSGIVLTKTQQNNLLEVIEEIFLEINFQNSKQLLCGIYHPPFRMINTFLTIQKKPQLHTSQMRKLLARDFNAHEKQGRLLDIFLNQHALHSNNKNLNWSKNLNNLSNIDLILTKCSKRFFKMDTIFTGLSAFNKLVLPIFKTNFYEI